ncbi:MAG: GNAT family N-acetyltransferase, partial [Nitrospirota bacterium]|nr:GNAT family N-acetyltransferase [Nitrospirota bacterium]
VSVEIMEQVVRVPGHYTVKVDPLSSKKLLHAYGFYYCDTLIEPYCSRGNFVFFQNDEAAISRTVALDDLTAICKNVFFHGRFHRDFNLDKKMADARYVNWLKELYRSGSVYALLYRSALEGFIGFSANKLVLHAIRKESQGKGLAKYLWSLVCKELFDHGHSELISSVSAANLPAINLYASLGFRFRNALDVYHGLVK